MACGCRFDSQLRIYDGMRKRFRAAKDVVHNEEWQKTLCMIEHYEPNQGSEKPLLAIGDLRRQNLLFRTTCINKE